MNQKKAIYMLITMVIVLVLLNITTIWFMFFKDKQQCQNSRQGGKGDYLIEKLELSPDQVAKFDILRQEHHQTVTPLNKEIRERKREYFSMINESRVDSLKVDSLSKVITELHRKVDVVTFYHFKSIREICTPVQQAKFQDLIEEGLFQPGQERGPMRQARE